ncbi:hypothetical protein HK098_008044, partial [Nowakowskiella sp. JEL0407]
ACSDYGLERDSAKFTIDILVILTNPDDAGIIKLNLKYGKLSKNVYWPITLHEVTRNGLFEFCSGLFSFPTGTGTSDIRFHVAEGNGTRLITSDEALRRCLIAKMSQFSIDTCQKPFSEWTFAAMKQQFNLGASVKSIQDMPRFNAGVSDIDVAEALEKTIAELETRSLVLRDVSGSNEANRREFISPVINNTAALLRGMVKVCPGYSVEGSYGIGSLDYALMYDSDIIGVTEAKRSDINQGLAQNLIQLYSVAQTNRDEKELKRRRDDMDMEEIVYGIVTDAEHWYFTRLLFSGNDEAEVSLSDQSSATFDHLVFHGKERLREGLTELFKQIHWLCDDQMKRRTKQLKAEGV